jgi:hypothetical protein
MEMLVAIYMSPTVSFHGYDTIRKTQFCENPGGGKYEWGLFCQQIHIGWMRHKLEAYADTILTYEITASSINFVKWLMQQNGLWDFVKRGETVTMGSTCDGGDMAWKLTQVSKGIKFVDPKMKGRCIGVAFVW